MYEWDAAKSTLNLSKHGVTFEEACQIFEGPVLSKRDERTNYGEDRIVSIGLLKGVVALAVVHTDREGVTRIISARLASRRERRFYNERFGQAIG